MKRIEYSSASHAPNYVYQHHPITDRIGTNRSKDHDLHHAPPGTTTHTARRRDVAPKITEKDRVWSKPGKRPWEITPKINNQSVEDPDPTLSIAGSESSLARKQILEKTEAKIAALRPPSPPPGTYDPRKGTHFQRCRGKHFTQNLLEGKIKDNNTLTWRYTKKGLPATIAHSHGQLDSDLTPVFDDAFEQTHGRKEFPDHLRDHFVKHVTADVSDTTPASLVAPNPNMLQQQIKAAGVDSQRFQFHPNQFDDGRGLKRNRRIQDEIQGHSLSYANPLRYGVSFFLTKASRHQPQQSSNYFGQLLARYVV